MSTFRQRAGGAGRRAQKEAFGTSRVITSPTAEICSSGCPPYSCQNLGMFDTARCDVHILCVVCDALRRSDALQRRGHSVQDRVHTERFITPPPSKCGGIKAKFHYAILVTDRFEADRRPVTDLLAGGSSLLAT